MAIEVLIKRRVKQGPQARKVVPLILRMRALATFQPGYLSGETLCNLDNPEDCLVISRWESRVYWETWLNSKERSEIQKKIEQITGEKAQYTIYAPMVARANTA